MSRRPIFSERDSGTLCLRQTFRRRMTWERNLPADVVAALWESPNSLLRRGECLQTKTRTTVVRVDCSSGSYLLKHHHWAGFWKTASKALAVSPNRRSFRDGLILADRGLPTPRPLALIEERLGPLNVCSYLLTEFVPGASLYRMLRGGGLDAATVDHLARQVAGIWQLLDDAQFSHNDLKPENFMVDVDHRVWLIDLENARWHTNRQSLRYGQAEDARRLLHVRSWRAVPEVAEQFRRRLRETPAVQAAIAEPDGPPHPLARPAVDDEAPQGITVLIPCVEQIEDLGECIDSVRDIADEILLVDAGLDDESRAVIDGLADCRWLQVDRIDSETYRRAVAAASHAWVFVVGPAERVSPDLAKEIQYLLAGNPSDDGYRIECRSYFYGRLVRFGESACDMPVRLVRRDGQTLPEYAGLESDNPADRIGRLRGKMIHHRARTIENHLAQVLPDACGTAQQREAHDRRPSLARTIFHPTFHFARSYLLRGGFLDGRAGLHRSILSAFSVYAREALLWDVRQAPRQFSGSDERHALKALPDADAETIAIPSAPRDADKQRLRRAA